MAPHLAPLGTCRWTQAGCGDSANTTVTRWAPSPGVGQARCPPAAPAPAAGLFPGLSGWEQGTVWHSLATSRHPHRLQGSPPSSTKHQPAPPWVLLFHRCFVSHITDVTSPRHRSSQMDLMSLCFLQLRKTSERLSLQDPEEPAGRCATVPTAGQRAAKGASGSAESSREPGTTSRAPLSSPGPATATLLTGPGR